MRSPSVFSSIKCGCINTYFAGVRIITLLHMRCLKECLGTLEPFLSDCGFSVTITNNTAILAISITTWFYSSEIALEFVTVDLDDFQVLHLKTCKYSHSQSLVITSNIIHWGQRDRLDILSPNNSTIFTL